MRNGDFVIKIIIGLYLFTIVALFVYCYNNRNTDKLRSNVAVEAVVDASGNSRGEVKNAESGSLESEDEKETIAIAFLYAIIISFSIFYFLLVSFYGSLDT